MKRPEPDSCARHTRIYLAIMVVITALGLPARMIQDQLPRWYVQYFGDYLWAMLLFFIFALILRKMSTLKVATVVTLLFTYSIEKPMITSGSSGRFIAISWLQW